MPKSFFQEFFFENWRNFDVTQKKLFTPKSFLRYLGVKFWCEKLLPFFAARYTDSLPIPLHSLITLVIMIFVTIQETKF